VIEFKSLPTKNNRVTSAYGWRNYNGGETHNGIDYGAIKVGVAGDNLYAVNNGYVARAYKSTSYGNCVIIQHNGWCVLYAHLMSLIVRTGQKVVTGQVIGKMGNTGCSSGVHLHFEVRDCNYNDSFWLRDVKDRTKYIHCINPQPYVNAFLNKTIVAPKVEVIQTVSKKPNISDNCQIIFNSTLSNPSDWVKAINCITDPENLFIHFGTLIEKVYANRKRDNADWKTILKRSALQANDWEYVINRSVELNLYPFKFAGTLLEKVNNAK